MRPRHVLWPFLAAYCLSGCAGLEGGWPAGRKPPAEVPQPTGADLVVAHLEAINQLGNATPAEQAEIAEAARRDWVAQPGATRALRYALILATPGHGGSDPVGARVLLGDVLAAPALLTPPERALAEIVYRDLNNLLALEVQVRELNAAARTAEERRDAAGLRRLQALSQENERLRRELGEARTKLEAIAELERAMVERHAGQDPPP